MTSAIAARPEDDEAGGVLSTAEVGDMFNLAPVAMFCLDYSGIKALLDEWNPSSADELKRMLQADRRLTTATTNATRIITVNRRALALYEAPDLDALQNGVAEIFREETVAAHIEELTGLWRGLQTVTFDSIDFTLSGRRFEARVNTSILPGYEANWEHVVVSVEDISAVVAGQRKLAESEAYATALFQRAPVALWVEDCSGLKRLMDGLRAEGVTDFSQYVGSHPGFMQRCINAVRVLDVNEQTLRLFEAPSKTALFGGFAEIFSADDDSALLDEFNSLWDGKLQFSRELVQRTLNGERIDLHMELSVLPGHEHDWSLVLVAQTDFTARKLVEQRLEYLTRHDILTGLHNRMAYTAEQERLVRGRQFPICVIIADLNGLKQVNDHAGHEAGDTLLCRAGAVLMAAAGEGMVARIGGDEFAILLPHADEKLSDAVIERIKLLTMEDNARQGGPCLSFATGGSLCHSEAELEEAVKQADMQMYRAKRAHYEALKVAD